jgi:hypothetical protein
VQTQQRGGLVTGLGTVGRIDSRASRRTVG